MMKMLMITLSVKCFTVSPVSTLPLVPVRPTPKKDYPYFLEGKSKGKKECNSAKCMK